MPETSAGAGDRVLLRTELEAGDLGAMVRQHGILYRREYGFDSTFEAYVAATLGEFGGSPSARERIWLAERDARLLGSIAILERSPETAQLRWFLIDPEARGQGLGRKLVTEALDFSRERGYRTVMLWTASILTAAARLYRAAGFCKVEEMPPSADWGVEVVLERYELALPVD